MHEQNTKQFAICAKTFVKHHTLVHQILLLCVFSSYSLSQARTLDLKESPHSSQHFTEMNVSKENGTQACTSMQI